RRSDASVIRVVNRHAGRASRQRKGRDLRPGPFVYSVSEAPAFFLATGLASALGLAALPFLPLAALRGAGVISNDGALSLIRTLTSPPLTSLPNSNSSASGCLIFSCTSRAMGRAP